jgi:uncharacterized membrane protein
VPRRGRRFLNGANARDARTLTERRNRHRMIAFGGSIAVGFLVSLLLPHWIVDTTRLVASYDAGALALVFFFWNAMSDDPDRTKGRAALEDPGRNHVYVVVLVAVVVGLVAAISIVGHGPKVHNDLEKWLAYGFGIGAIAIGWFLVHTVYTLRYAHLYWYDDDGDGTACGGITFPGTDRPSDYDFAYFSFCIGASFAVSDPQVTETRVRREIMWHSIISFAYNSVIVAILINLLAGIFSASTASDAGAGH